MNAPAPHTYSTKLLKVAIAAGGTGGHIFPAIAVAEELHRLTNGNCIVEFIGTAERIEATIVPKHGYPFYTIPIMGLQRLFSLSTLKLPLHILLSILKSRRILKQIKPDCVLCTGAYVSYPVGIAASQLSIPLFLMESNAFPGKTIRRLAPRATYIYTAFEESQQYFAPSVAHKIFPYGNPVRSDFSALPDPASARAALGLATDKPTVLIFGGSLGARSLNSATLASLEKFRQTNIQVLWQTGTRYSPSSNMNTSGAIVMQFIDDMRTAYAAADVIVCRAGATTIAELAITRKPAILVPFPHAAHDHQTYNARALEAKGAAILVHDVEIKERLFSSVHGLLSNPIARQAMQRSLEPFAKPHAAHHIALSILQYCRPEHDISSAVLSS
ncbi:MAG: undecaprenyldiphospho-muramoylpentapeptide beta-N-acetylglucosaminyltransferase [Bacteroidota bacterium]|nr:undecaprenyldiphospho-muramoylpentapeptide beta-N-acetylglucosaminyltransferase [Candidatus Kapabacteria bacterium]MDW8219051.1 undecaprenyldiphospho-muramoylpentapeptide beta-N-acetylglucosaminyltransferase [Bacteroidota bacterium]